MLDEEALERALAAAGLSAPARWDDVTESTNATALARAAEGAPSWTSWPPRIRRPVGAGTDASGGIDRIGAAAQPRAQTPLATGPGRTRVARGEVAAAEAISEITGMEIRWGGQTT